MANSALWKENAVLVNPKLAQAIGLNEAIVIQQIQYWVNINRKSDKNFRDGHYWTYNTYTEWQAQFPWWSKRTVRRIINNLEKDGYIESTDKYNKMTSDKTKWYRVLEDNLPTSEPKKSTHPPGQNDHTGPGQSGQSRPGQNDQTVTRDYTETNKLASAPAHDNSNQPPPQPNAFQSYQEHFVTDSPHTIRNKLGKYIDALGDDVVVYGIERVKAWNERKVSEGDRPSLSRQKKYLFAVLDRWRDQGITSLDGAKQEHRQWRIDQGLEVSTEVRESTYTQSLLDEVRRRKEALGITW